MPWIFHLVPKLSGSWPFSLFASATASLFRPLFTRTSPAFNISFGPALLFFFSSCWSILRRIYVVCMCMCVCVVQTAAGISMSLRHKNEMQPTRRATMSVWLTHMMGEGGWCWELGDLLFVSDGHPCKHCTFGLSKANASKILFWPTARHTHTRSRPKAIPFLP